MGNQEFPRIPWAQFLTMFDWKQGEHVAMIAPTGAGKTTLMAELMPLRKYSIMLGTKPKDRSYHKIMREHDLARIDSVKEIKSWHTKYLLWPQYTEDIERTMVIQKRAFREGLNTVVNQGGWTLWVDESKYIAEMLGLKRELTFALEQLRSIKATVVCGAQRPAWLPMSVLSSSTHVFIWKTTLREDAKRLADIGGIDADAVFSALKSLDRHEFLYIRTRGTDARVVISQVGR